MIYFSPEYEPEELRKERLAETWDIADIESIKKFAEDENCQTLREQLTEACAPLREVLSDFKFYLGFCLALKTGDTITEDAVMQKIIEKLGDRIITKDRTKEEITELTRSLQIFFNGLYGATTAIDFYIKAAISEDVSVKNINDLRTLYSQISQWSGVASRSFTKKSLPVVFRYLKEVIIEVSD